jgi:hypothetical protein
MAAGDLFRRRECPLQVKPDDYIAGKIREGRREKGEGRREKGEDRKRASSAHTSTRTVEYAKPAAF